MPQRELKPVMEMPSIAEPSRISPRASSGLRLILANASLAKYPEGGGHWAVFLQYLWGLRALGHDFFWLELLEPSADPARDRKRIEIFFRRFQRYGFAGRVALLLLDRRPADACFETAAAHGMSKTQLKEIIQSADLVWNFCCALRAPMLALFKGRRAFIDLDPGMVQLPLFDRAYALCAQDPLFTVGSNIGEPDCQVPTAGRSWQRFWPILYLPYWRAGADPGPRAPFTSVTQWTWDEYWHEQQLLSFSKRRAYLKYLDMPQKTGRPFELAANIHPGDQTGDRELLQRAGWRLATPNWVARSPAKYREYIERSRAEFCCPKPFYRQFHTGWFSDRSAAYLASGRPVLAEDTGFSKHLPTGRGLLTFSNLSEAVAGAGEIDGNYPLHRRAARELAEEYFSSAKWLPAMLSACGR